MLSTWARENQWYDLLYQHKQNSALLGLIMTQTLEKLSFLNASWSLSLLSTYFF